MSPCSAGDMRMVALTSATSGKTPAVVTIPVCGGAGVDLGCVGLALGLEPSTVTLNGHFISRGADLVSKLAWNSLLSFFAARGLPDGGSLHDPIVVRGKPIASTDHVDRLSFKRKSTINDENPYKNSRFLEGCSKKQNVGTKQLADSSCHGIKRQLKLVDDYPSKKGKIGECNSDYHSIPNMRNIDRLCSNGEGSAIDRNFGSEQEADDADFLCINKRLKLHDDLPIKKVKIDESNSDLCAEPLERSKVSALECYKGLQRPKTLTELLELANDHIAADEYVSNPVNLGVEPSNCHLQKRGPQNDRWRPKDRPPPFGPSPL